jgi:hypothetical protein
MRSGNPISIDCCVLYAEEFHPEILDFARNDRLLVFARIARFGARRLGPWDSSDNLAYLRSRDDPMGRDVDLGLSTASAAGVLVTGFTIVFGN